MVDERYESVPDLDSGIKRMHEDGKYAFIWSPESTNYAFAAKPCAISTINHYHLLPSPIAMYIQQNSQFTDAFNF